MGQISLTSLSRAVVTAIEMSPPCGRSSRAKQSKSLSTLVLLRDRSGHASSHGGSRSDSGLRAKLRSDGNSDRKVPLDRPLVLVRRRRGPRSNFAVSSSPVVHRNRSARVGLARGVVIQGVDLVRPSRRDQRARGGVRDTPTESSTRTAGSKSVRTSSGACQRRAMFWSDYGALTPRPRQMEGLERCSRRRGRAHAADPRRE